MNMWWTSKPDKAPRILIIEDDLNNHPLYQTAFGTAGFEVILRRNADGDFVSEVATIAPDIISMDIMIGKSGAEVEREGLEATALLKSDERTQNIPIIILTNFTDEVKIEHAKELGAIDYISLQGHSIKEIPLIFKRYVEDPEHFSPSHPLMR